MGDTFIRYIILKSVSAQLRNQFMPLTFSTIRYVEIFRWEMLLPYSLLHTSLFPNHLFTALFHVLKFYEIIFIFKKVHQVVVWHKTFYKNLRRFPSAISKMGFCGLWRGSNGKWYLGSASQNWPVLGKLLKLAQGNCTWRTIGCGFPPRLPNSSFEFNETLITICDAFSKITF